MVHNPPLVPTFSIIWRENVDTERERAPPLEILLSPFLLPAAVNKHTCDPSATMTATWLARRAHTRQNQDFHLWCLVLSHESTLVIYVGTCSLETEDCVPGGFFGLFVV